MRKFLTELSDLVLARECIGCKKLGTLICAACRSQVSNRSHIMRDLRFDDLAEDLRIPVAIAHRYAPPIDSMIYRYKDNQIPELSQLLADLLRGAIEEIPIDHPILIPIPSRRSSIRTRGFDPMDLIASRLSRGGYPVAAWLVDQRGAGRSKTLGITERVIAANDAFCIGRIPDHYVRDPIPAIVIDDVTTSGATFSAAVSQLLLAGVHIVGCAAVAGARKT